MEYEDRITIATPEGLTLDVTLAGVGSRLIAAFIDGLIQLAVIVALGWLTFSRFPEAWEEEGPSGFLVVFAIINVLIFIVLFAYHALFEALSSGRTPGKRAAGVRVVQVGGRPIDAKAAVIRNLMRLIDILPGMYGIAVIAILVTERNQRLGDVVAGTIVIREKKATSVVSPSAQEPVAGLETWDVTGVTVDDLATVQRFLERRQDLPDESRQRIAVQLAERLRPKVVGAPVLRAETFLEHLASAKRSRI